MTIVCLVQGDRYFAKTNYNKVLKRRSNVLKESSNWILRVNYCIISQTALQVMIKQITADFRVNIIASTYRR